MYTLYYEYKYIGQYMRTYVGKFIHKYIYIAGITHKYTFIDLMVCLFIHVIVQ